jgi:radical SAM superfamily enzyme YgiQ (UPF0313 family)
MKNTKILALNLALRPESPVKIFPVGLAYVLSSVKRAGYELELFDIDLGRYSYDRVIDKISEKKWDIVLLGCIVTGYKVVKKVVSEIRRHNPACLIVVGNSVASSIPDILLSKTEADVAVIGEGDVTAVEIVENWGRKRDLSVIKGIYYKLDGEIRKNGKREVISDISSIKHPIYDIFNVEEYIKAHRNMVGEPLPMERELIRSFPINTARGCINHCTFCYHCFIGDKYRFRSASSIVEEIKNLKRLYGINYIHLWDDLTFFYLKQIDEFVNLLLKESLDVYWVAAIRGNLFQSDSHLELLEKMKKSGCLSLGYALESADPNILRDMKKNVSLRQFSRQKELLDKADIQSVTSIVLGYPRETPETIAKTYQFCLNVGMYPSTGYLLPQPATPIYQWAVKEGIISDEESYLLRLGDRQDLRINLTKMSDQEFNETVMFWLKKLNRELNIGLDEKNLIKTQFKRDRKEEANL